MEAQVHFHGQLGLFRQQMSSEGSVGGVKTENLIYDFSLLGLDSTGQDAHAEDGGGKHILGCFFFINVSSQSSCWLS